MADEHRKEGFEKRLGQALRDRAGRLDASTRSRLTQARSAALAELESGRARGPRRWWSLGAATAAAVIVAVVMMERPEAPIAETGADVEPLEDLDIVLAEDSLEFIEDWEFYRWLEDVQDVG